jgi:hypothetical protein
MGLGNLEALRACASLDSNPIVAPVFSLAIKRGEKHAHARTHTHTHARTRTHTRAHTHTHTRTIKMLHAWNTEANRDKRRLRQRRTQLLHLFAPSRLNAGRNTRTNREKRRPRQ